MGAPFVFIDRRFYLELLNASYAELQEYYLSDLNGTTSWDVVVLLVTIVVFGFVALYSRCLVKYDRPALCFIQDMVLFVIPSVLLITVLNDYTALCACVLIPSTTSVVVYEVFVRPSRLSRSEILNSKINLKHSPYVTHFKAVITLLSIICILAVDFKVFPLKYAKTETYGYSLMDTGVAFFIASNGITVNIRKIKSLKKLVVSNLPILLLGFARYASLEILGYPKNVTEYGKHWNFFFTLAIVKFVGSLLMMASAGIVGSLGFGLLLIHQCILTSGVEEWVFSDAPRRDLLSANREGIASLLGYISFYLLSAGLGQILVFGKTLPTARDRISDGLITMITSVVILGTTHLLSDITPQPSRRLANSTFIIWMSGICLLVIGLSMVYEVIIILIFRRREVTSREEDRSILILEAISANNLLFFLLCNLLTGAVNLSMRTLLVPPFYSLLVIFSYTALSCAVITIIYVKKWPLKFW